MGASHAAARIAGMRSHSCKRRLSFYCYQKSNFRRFRWTFLSIIKSNCTSVSAELQVLPYEWRLLMRPNASLHATLVTNHVLPNACIVLHRIASLLQNRLIYAHLSTAPASMSQNAPQCPKSPAPPARFTSILAPYLCLFPFHFYLVPHSACQLRARQGYSQRGPFAHNV
jgi:hypothetical protein